MRESSQEKKRKRAFDGVYIINRVITMTVFYTVKRQRFFEKPLSFVNYNYIIITLSFVITKRLRKSSDSRSRLSVTNICISRAWCFVEYNTVNKSKGKYAGSISSYHLYSV